jgi:hypothetical protein
LFPLPGLFVSHESPQCGQDLGPASKVAARSAEVLGESAAEIVPRRRYSTDLVSKFDAERKSRQVRDNDWFGRAVQQAQAAALRDG